VSRFAERARCELLATGEKARKRSPETFAELTAQEALIARLASEGRANPEIGAELFLSPRTVEWHLRKSHLQAGCSHPQGTHQGYVRHRRMRLGDHRPRQRAAMRPLWCAIGSPR
jgi:FixJ family two-component response regulator